MSKETDAVSLKNFEYQIAATTQAYDDFKNTIAAPVAELMDMQTVQQDLKETELKITELKAKFKEMSDTDIRLEIEAPDLEELEQRAEQLRAQLDEMSARPLVSELGSVEQAAKTASLGLEGTRLSARQMGAAFGMAIGGAGSLRGVITSLSGMIFMLGGKMDAVKIKATAMWAAITLGVSVVINIITKVIDRFSKLSDEVTDGFVDIGNVIKNISRSAVGGVRNLRIFERTLNSIGRTLGGIYKHITNISKSTTVFKTLHNAVGDVKTVMGDWLHTSREFNSLLNQIRVNLLTAFIPVVEILTPIILNFMQLLAKFSAVLAQFMAQLAGMSYEQSREKARALFEQARGIEGIGAAAQAAQKELRPFLTSFDALNVAPSDMRGLAVPDLKDLWDFGFDVGDLSKFDVFIDKLRKLFSEVDTDYWRGFGRKIAVRIADEINRIPWGLIRSAAHIFGQNLGALFSGILGTNASLLTAFGRGLAEALNTGLEFLYGVAKTFDFKDVGREIANSINAFFRTFDFKLLASTINIWSHGLLDLILEALRETEWSAVGRSIGDLLIGIDWIGILAKVGETIKEALKSALSVLGELFSSDIVSPIPQDSPVFGAYIGMMTAIGEEIPKKNQWALDIAKGLAEGLNNALGDKELWGQIGDTLISIFDTLLASLVVFVETLEHEKILAAFEVFINKVLDYLSDEDFQENIAKLVNSIVDTLIAFIDAIPIDRVMEIAAAIVRKIDLGKVIEYIAKSKELKNIPQDIIDEFTDAMIIEKGGFIAAVLTAWDQIKYINPFAESRGLLSRWFKPIGEDVVDGLNEGALEESNKTSKKTTEEITDNFVSGLNDGFEIRSPSRVTQRIGVNLISSLFGSVTATFNKTKGNIISVVDNLKNLFSGIDLGQKGKDLLNGFVGGITSVAGSAYDTVKGVAENVVGFFSDIFNFGSPSRLFKQFGRWVIQGFGIGAENEERNVLRTMHSICEHITDTFDDTDVGVDMGMQILNGLESTYDLIIRSIDGLVARIDKAFDFTLGMPSVPLMAGSSGISYTAASALAEKGGLAGPTGTEQLSELAEKLDRNYKSQQQTNNLLMQLISVVGGLKLTSSVDMRELAIAIATENNLELLETGRGF
jgi:hypothetical protein